MKLNKCDKVIDLDWYTGCEVSFENLVNNKEHFKSNINYLNT